MKEARTEKMHVLALDAWLGGSHQQFLEGWRRRSCHAIELRGLRPRAFRWRMRSSAWQFARDLERDPIERPDALFVTGFTDVAGLRGMLPRGWRELPVVLYMHENQLSYPRREQEGEGADRDHHLGFTQILSCLAADAVLFISEFHRAEFQSASDEFLRRLPKPNPRQALKDKIERAEVIAPGLDFEEIPLGPGAPRNAPLRVLFNQRWEWDKAPEVALCAVERAAESGAALELVLLGERAPTDLESRAKIVHTGFAEDRAEYSRLIGSCDVVISTALHEFFGIAVGEAIAAGCAPLVPKRLAYPEVVQSVPGRMLYKGDDDEAALAGALTVAAGSLELLRDREMRLRRRAAVASFSAVETALALDRTLRALLRSL